MKREFWETERGLLLLRGWARNGLGGAEIAKRMKMGIKKLEAYEKENETVCSALSMGKEEVDLSVEEALLDKALKGDVRACVYWLKNRKAEHWADKPAAGARGGDDGGHLERLAALINGAEAERDIEDFL